MKLRNKIGTAVERLLVSIQKIYPKTNKLYLIVRF